MPRYIGVGHPGFSLPPPDLTVVLEGYLWKRYSTCLGYRWHRRFFVLSSDYGGLLFILKHNQSKVAYNIFEFRDAPESFVAESDEDNDWMGHGLRGVEHPTEAIPDTFTLNDSDIYDLVLRADSPEIAHIWAHRIQVILDDTKRADENVRQALHEEKANQALRQDNGRKGMMPRMRDHHEYTHTSFDHEYNKILKEKAKLANENHPFYLEHKLMLLHKAVKYPIWKPISKEELMEKSRKRQAKKRAEMEEEEEERGAPIDKLGDGGHVFDMVDGHQDNRDEQEEARSSCLAWGCTPDSSLVDPDAVDNLNLLDVDKEDEDVMPLSVADLCGCGVYQEGYMERRERLLQEQEIGMQGGDLFDQEHGQKGHHISKAQFDLQALIADSFEEQEDLQSVDMRDRLQVDEQGEACGFGYLLYEDGTCYKGEVQHGQRHGLGVMDYRLTESQADFKEVATLTGYWVDDQPNGMCKLRNLLGRIFYIGEMKGEERLSEHQQIEWQGLDVPLHVNIFPDIRRKQDKQRSPIKEPEIVEKGKEGKEKEEKEDERDGDEDLVSQELEEDSLNHDYGYGTLGIGQYEHVITHNDEDDEQYVTHMNAKLDALMMVDEESEQDPALYESILEEFYAARTEMEKEMQQMQADIAIEQAKLEAMEEEIRVAEAIEGKEGE